MVKVIAEIGINHDGDLDLAKQLITHAALAKCWAVKFQIRTPELCVPKTQWNVPRETEKWGTIPYIEYKRKMEFSEEQLKELYVHAHGLNLQFFASCWDVDSVVRLARISRAYIKVASASITNNRLLEAIKRERFSHVFLSTGMSTEKQVMNALDHVRGRHNVVTVMHSVSVYPCPNRCLHLSRITRLRELVSSYATVDVGYSGHEPGITPSLIAASLGASYIERHLTYDKAAKGTDHAASLTLPELHELTAGLDEVLKMMGSPIIAPLPEEASAIAKLRG